MRTQAMICDECGKDKNAPFNKNVPKGYVVLESAQLATLESDGRDIKRWAIDSNIDPDFCSKACLLKWFTRWLNKQK